MSSCTGNPGVVLAMNIDCENVDYVFEDIAGFRVLVPRVIEGKLARHFLCREYSRSGTTNGRFIFKFRDLNPKWGYNRLKIMRTEILSFKRYDMIEPIIRVVDPVMAVALDSACESIVTSAVAGKIPGSRIRSYAATDFMVREQAEQALLKLKVYSDLGLGVDGKLVFIINNSGYVGEHDFMGNRIGTEGGIGRGEAGGEGRGIGGEERGKGIGGEGGSGKRSGEGNGNGRGVGNHGEKIKVGDSKRLVELVEERKIEKWVINPVFGYFVPDPRELEKIHGMTDFRERFNPLNYYTAEQILAFAERDIQERTDFLKLLFSGQEHESDLMDVIHYWEKVVLPEAEEVETYYRMLYG